ncbi:3653_t:CDS:2 [Funneliformis caledonium]|uniref:3653_t:CDS:1 n=1 Tax=Funneliformis caledonium TaxID=1117310 RepID=A0A9N9E6E3_9GLOM|nr:3653_t:CDS:2 [Funneliformis caledonium]
MDIEKSLNFMDSVIDHKMKTSNELTNPISCNNPLYRILVGTVRGIAVIMEQILVDWAKRKYTIDNWLDCVRGRKDPQDIIDEKQLDFFDNIVLDPFFRLDEESFLKFILHMHLITYRLPDLIGIHQMTIKEIYFGCLLASNEILSKTIDIQSNVNYRSEPLKKKKHDPDNPFTWNKLIDRKKVSVITTGRFIMFVRSRSGSSDSLTSHAEEQYKFSSAIESGFPVHKIPTGEFTLEDFKKELKKATEGCECFIVITVKRFLHEVNELPSRVSRDLTTRTSIVFGDQFLEFMGIYGDFTRFIAGEVSDEREEDKVLEMMMDVGKEESEMIVDD